MSRDIRAVRKQKLSENRREWEGKRCVCPIQEDVSAHVALGIDCAE